MCFEFDSVPPIPEVSGGAFGHRDLVLTAQDGNSFAAFEALATEPKGPAVIVLPDVRGLYPFYEELALRFAEQGYDSVAIDYFGRTAGISKRDGEFSYKEHVEQTTASGVTADTAAAIAHLRKADPQRKVFTVGFCFGGSNSWHQAANGHRLAGAIGFYGNPNREFPKGAMPLVGRTAEFACPILGLMAGEDSGIPEVEVEGFRNALATAGVEYEIVTYQGAPHSFFDRRHTEFADASTDAWNRVLAFLAAHH